MAKPPHCITLTVELTDDQAWHLALFVKRLAYVDFRANAQDEAEAQTIGKAVARLQDALTQAGYAPR